jgi:hypothetical protein
LVNYCRQLSQEIIGSYRDDRYAKHNERRRGHRQLELSTPGAGDRRCIAGVSGT